MATITDKNVEGLTIRSVRVETNWERFSWLFMRLSGIALLVLAVGHMVIQHVLNSSANLSMQFVAAQWSSWGWKAYDILLLWMAIPHGFNGLRNILLDHVHSKPLVRLLSIVLGLLVAATVIWATVGMVLFDASKFQ